MSATEKIEAIVIDHDPTAPLLMETARRAATFVLSSLGAAILFLAVLLWTAS